MHDDQATAALLSQVFPGTRIGSSEYLRWLYRASPMGPVVETNIDDDAGRAAHYAVVPLRLATASGEITVGLSLNTAVAERARGGGVFTTLAEQTIAQAKADGYDAVLGVANANSTPGFLRRLGFTLIGPLPATVLLPRPGRSAGVQTAPAAEALLGDDAEVEALLAAASPANRGVAPRWTPETLAWRLASPGATYLVHRAPGLLAVSTRERRAGVSVAVLMGIFGDHDLDRSEVDAVVRAACRHHRAPAALHVGHQSQAPLHGLPLPQRLRPSPLNLIFRWLDERQVTAPSFGRFELVDFDAY